MIIVCCGGGFVSARSDNIDAKPTLISGQTVCADPQDLLVLRGRNVIGGADKLAAIITCRDVTFEPGAYLETTVPLVLTATFRLAGDVDIRGLASKPPPREPRSAREAARFGLPGGDGDAGVDGSRCNQMFIGHRSEPGAVGHRGGEGAAGRSGRAGARGRPGAAGPDISVFAAGVAPGTTIVVQTRGADGEPGQPGEVGQDGATGGVGGTGGRGGAGGVCFRPSAGGVGAQGGPGGAGGPGGRGGDGGAGGPGGSVTIALARDSAAFWAGVEVDNRGGAPGAGGSGGPGGHGGKGGAGGLGGPGGRGGAVATSPARAGRGLFAVRDGAPGQPGFAGYDGRQGRDGPDGAAGPFGALGRAAWRIAD